MLIVDDEVAVLDVTRSMACSLGRWPLVAGSAEAALALVQLYSPHIHHALIDLHMPGTDGAALARRLRLSHPDIHLTLMTGDEPEARALLAREPIADNLLVKPFALSELENALAEHARVA